MLRKGRRSTIASESGLANKTSVAVKTMSRGCQTASAMDVCLSTIPLRSHSDSGGSLENNSTLESTPFLQIWCVCELNWTCFPVPPRKLEDLLSVDDKFTDSRIREALTFENDKFNDSRILDGLNSNPSEVISQKIGIDFQS
jgi:hypothetical protein